MCTQWCTSQSIYIFDFKVKQFFRNQYWSNMGSHFYCCGSNLHSLYLKNQRSCSRCLTLQHCLSTKLFFISLSKLYLLQQVSMEDFRFLRVMKVSWEVLLSSQILGAWVIEVSRLG